MLVSLVVLRYQRSWYLSDVPIAEIRETANISLFGGDIQSTLYIVNIKVCSVFELL